MARHFVFINTGPALVSEVRKTAKEVGLDEVSLGVYKTHMHHLPKDAQFQHLLNSIQKFRAISPETQIFLVRASEIHDMNKFNPV